MKQINNLILKGQTKISLENETSLSKHRIHIMNSFENFKSNEPKMIDLCIQMLSKMRVMFLIKYQKIKQKQQESIQMKI
jgi:hypothetical protein